MTFSSVVMLGVTAAVLCACSSVGTTAYAPTETGKIAYFHEGTTQPTVVFQSGLGDDKAVWHDVIKALGPTVSVFAYDRPGYGSSSPTTLPRDPCAIAQEQRQAMAEAGVKPPYLLVGHSLGGLYEYVYAKLYPEDVLGVVLLDPTHPTHLARMKKDAPAQATVLDAMMLVSGTAARNEFNEQASCLESVAQESHAIVPTRLLVRSDFSLIEQGAFQTMTQTLNQDWQKLTAAPTVQVVPHAGHYIQNDQPAAVAAAIVSLMPPSGN